MALLSCWGIKESVQGAEAAICNYNNIQTRDLWSLIRWPESPRKPPNAMISLGSPHFGEYEPRELLKKSGNRFFQGRLPNMRATWINEDTVFFPDCGDGSLALASVAFTKYFIQILLKKRLRIIRHKGFLVIKFNK
jgi:hypothetical protein